MEFYESKLVEEFDFPSIPIWLRVERLPLGLMNRAVAEAIGDDIGEFMEVDVDSADSMVGRAVRIKIRMEDLGLIRASAGARLRMSICLTSATSVALLVTWIMLVQRSWGRTSLLPLAES